MIILKFNLEAERGIIYGFGGLEVLNNYLFYKIPPLSFCIMPAVGNRKS